MSGILIVPGAGARQQSFPAQDATPQELRQMLLAPMESGVPGGATGSRSVPLALGLSAVLPGAGQAYNRQWIKAGIAMAAEAAVITATLSYRMRGLNAEDAFRETAHADWNPAKYGSWLNDYTDYLEQEHGATITAPHVNVDIGVDFMHPGSWTESQQQDVDRMFAQIRALERQSFHPETDAVFSHQIPGFADQQYYELIGKYFQFAPGWEDYPEWRTEEGFTPAIDPELSGAGGDKVNVSDGFFDYASDHARAQDLLRRASRLSLFLIVNHVAAAVDAAVSAKLFNDRIQSNMGLGVGPGGRATAVWSVSFRF